jgi:hypothetical protein
MAQHLQAARHVTDAIGKWHLGSEAQFHPLSRGFDEFFGFLPGATSYLPEPGGKSILLRNREPAPQTQSDQFGSEAMAFAESHRAEPWLPRSGSPVSSLRRRAAAFRALRQRQERQSQPRRVQCSEKASEKKP